MTLFVRTGRRAARGFRLAIRHFEMILIIRDKKKELFTFKPSIKPIPRAILFEGEK